MIEACLGISLFLCSVWPVRAWLPVSGCAGPAKPAAAVVSCGSRATWRYPSPEYPPSRSPPLSQPDVPPWIPSFLVEYMNSWVLNSSLCRSTSGRVILSGDGIGMP